MRLVKIGLANVNATVGAVETNTSRAIAIAKEMAAADVTLGAFQEQLISGYPPEDLVHWSAFVDAQKRQLERFAAETQSASTVFCLGLTVAHQAHRYNCAAVVHRGKILGIVPKEKLPTYNVFYEARTFSHGTPYHTGLLWNSTPFGDLLFEFDWGILATEVCEDLWTPDGPMRRRCYAGAEVVVNVSASPYRVGLLGARRSMISTRSADSECIVVYSNAIGGQDGLIFDGGGFVAQNGKMVIECERFRDGWQATTVDIDRTVRSRAENTTWRDDAQRFLEHQRSITTIKCGESFADRSRLKYPAPVYGNFMLPAAKMATDARSEFAEEILDALALGLWDYFEKNRFKYFGVALSGGRDSALALLVAVRAIERRGKRAAHDLMRTFYMPTRYSSDKTRAAAERLAADVGVPLKVVPLDDAFEREMAAAKSMLMPGEDLTPITIQNIQARIRGMRMWNWANSVGGLFLQTSNMSEKAVGYTTIGGDLEGGLSVIANLPKTVVIYLLEYLREIGRYPGLDLVLAHPAGPELAANQEGEKELMPFRILDTCFALFAGEKLAASELTAALGDLFPDEDREKLAAWAERFARLFTTSIYKWVQAPLALHVGNLDLDRERALQLPVVEKDEWRK